MIPERSSIIFFTLLLGGMIGIITKSEALAAVAKTISKYATTNIKGNEFSGKASKI